MKRALVLAVAIVVGVAACGDGDDSGSTATQVEESPSDAVEQQGAESEDGAGGDDDVWDNGVVELRVGDCVNDLPTSDEESYDAEIVSCDTPHDHEFFFIGSSGNEEELFAELAAYIGIEDDELADYLIEHGLAVISNWDQRAGMAHSLMGATYDADGVADISEGGQLDMPYRDAGA